MSIGLRRNDNDTYYCDRESLEKVSSECSAERPQSRCGRRQRLRTDRAKRCRKDNHYQNPDEYLEGRRRRGPSAGNSIAKPATGPLQQNRIRLRKPADARLDDDPVSSGLPETVLYFVGLRLRREPARTIQPASRPQDRPALAWNVDEDGAREFTGLPPAAVDSR